MKMEPIEVTVNVAPETTLDSLQSLLDMLKSARNEFPTQKSYVASLEVMAGNVKIVYSLSISREGL